MDYGILSTEHVKVRVRNSAGFCEVLTPRAAVQKLLPSRTPHPFSAAVFSGLQQLLQFILLTELKESMSRICGLVVVLVALVGLAAARDAEKVIQKEPKVRCPGTAGVDYGCLLLDDVRRCWGQGTDWCLTTGYWMCSVDTDCAPYEMDPCLPFEDAKFEKLG